MRIDQSKLLMLLFSEEMIEIVDLTQSASLKNTYGNDVFIERVAYVKLKRQVYPKFVNNYPLTLRFS